MTRTIGAGGYPIRPITYPSAAACDVNGRMPANRRRSIGMGGSLELTAADAWDALYVGAAAEGFTGDNALTWTPGGTYRTFEQQETVFVIRFRPVPGPDYDTLRDTFYMGQWFELKPEYAGAAVAKPGDSNHGRGVTVDTATGPNQSAARYVDTPVRPDWPRSILAWLKAPAPAEWQDEPGVGLTNAETFGWCWEGPAAKVEPWHLNYYRGDAFPARAAAVLAYIGRPR